jgi:uncharacterized protein YggE
MNDVPRYVWAALAALLVLASLEKIGRFIAGPESGQPQVITVTGMGEVNVIPDLAEVVFQIATEARTAGEAQKQSAEKSRTIQSFVEGQGIKKEDVQTTQYRLEPMYFYVENKPPQLSGFRLTQGLRVKVRNLDKLGEIIAGGVAAGANQVEGPSFAVDKKEELIGKARVLAFKQAREKARLQAEAAGARLGKIVAFSEDSGPVPMRMEKAKMMMAADMAAAPALEPGSQDIQVHVSLSYQLR